MNPSLVSPHILACHLALSGHLWETVAVAVITVLILQVLAWHLATVPSDGGWVGGCFKHGPLGGGVNSELQALGLGMGGMCWTRAFSAF